MVGSTQTKWMQTVQTWSSDIFQSDGPIWKSDTPLWLLEPQDFFFMICNEWINACNATLNFGYVNGHSSHLPRLNYGCKIECLQGWPRSLSLSLLLPLCLHIQFLRDMCTSSLWLVWDWCLHIQSPKDMCMSFFVILIGIGPVLACSIRRGYLHTFLGNFDWYRSYACIFNSQKICAQDV